MRILIPKPTFVISLNPDSMKNTADPDPTRCDSRSRDCATLIPALFGPLIPDPIYLDTTLFTTN